MAEAVGAESRRTCGQAVRDGLYRRRRRRCHRLRCRRRRRRTVSRQLQDEATLPLTQVARFVVCACVCARAPTPRRHRSRSLGAHHARRVVENGERRRARHARVVSRARVSENRSFTRPRTWSSAPAKIVPLSPRRARRPEWLVTRSLSRELPSPLRSPLVFGFPAQVSCRGRQTLKPGFCATRQLGELQFTCRRAPRRTRRPGCARPRASAAGAAAGARYLLVVETPDPYATRHLYLGHWRQHDPGRGRVDERLGGARESTSARQRRRRRARAVQTAKQGNGVEARRTSLVRDGETGWAVHLAEGAVARPHRTPHTSHHRCFRSGAVAIVARQRRKAEREETGRFSFVRMTWVLRFEGDSCARARSVAAWLGSSSLSSRATIVVVVVVVVGGGGGGV